MSFPVTTKETSSEDIQTPRKTRRLSRSASPPRQRHRPSPPATPPPKLLPLLLPNYISTGRSGTATEPKKETESEAEDNLVDLEKHLREKALRFMRKAQVSPQS
ncbi:Serine/arginine repetitive matrix protein 1 [Heterocephalus glaber]|uniref:Serine/arginine repetitive matrix protein 1 n=1 Tax=Heterocephalus glaber TaxID=10181 RepID=G5BQN5_HETGA|nr:Serine/arginine repetitive matrix protein 1 [Heterocephalus glaber]